MTGEVVLAFPASIPKTTRIRSTLLLGGVTSLRDAGLGDAYDAVQPAEVRAALEGAVVGMWLPIEIAVAHYRACDELGLSSDTVIQLGRGTFERTKGLLLGAATGMARGAGVTPWTMMPHLQRFWMRGFDGGGVRALRRGPKEVEVDIVDCPLACTRYFRAALRGLFTVLLELVCQKAYVHERPFGDRDTMLGVRAQWV